MHRTCCQIALLCFAFAGSGCGLVDALTNSSNSRVDELPDLGTPDGGVIVDDAGNPIDVGDTDADRPAECTPEGDANACADGLICHQGKCEPQCRFGNGMGVNPIGEGELVCGDDLVCVPVTNQDINRFGACVSPARFDAAQASSTCAEVVSDADDYCVQLFRDNDYSCQAGRCEIPCADDDVCGNGSYCERDGNNGFCVLADCEEAGSDAGARDQFCANLFNRLGDEHPNGDAVAFTTDHAYCLNGTCYVRRDSEAQTACSAEDACSGEDTCVSGDYCMTTCADDEPCAEGLTCAYTIPNEERTDTDEVSGFVCVDNGNVEVSQNADPIAFCDTNRPNGETGMASWDRESGTCTYVNDTPDSNSIWYVLIRDTTPNCESSAVDGDLPGVEDPGADISFVGLSNTAVDMPTTGDAFGSVYAQGKVVMVFPGTTNLDNDYPGYGHLAPLLQASGDDPDEVRYRTSDGCPAASPAVNTTYALGCGGAILVEFRNASNTRENLDFDGTSKFIVVSEYNGACDTSGIGDPAAVPENYSVTYCPTGFDFNLTDPAGQCVGALSTFFPTDPMAPTGGPTIHGFPP